MITVIVGTLNNIYKNDKLPGLRFYFGNGVLFLMLSLLAEMEEEIAKTLALAVATFVVIGEGGGVLDHFMGKGTSKSTLDTTPSAKQMTPETVQHAIVAQQPPPRGALPAVAAGPLFSPVKPVLPHS